MTLVNLTSNLSKINQNFKNPNRFDTNKDSILDNSYKGKALVGKDLNQTLEYQLKTKLNEQKAAPNNRSWSVPNIADKPNFTPTSNYIDATKLFYGGKITPYSKGTPLDSITFTSKLDAKILTNGALKYPANKPYSFDKPAEFIGTTDFSLPFVSYTNSRVGRYLKGTPLNSITFTSKWFSFDYKKEKPYSFDKPFNYPTTYPNDFSLPFDSYTTSGRVTNYSKGTPLDSITFTSKLDAKILTNGIAEPLKYPVIKPYSFNAPSGYNTKSKNDFSLPFEAYTTSRLGKYSTGTPLEIITKDSKWKSFDYPTTVPTTPYSFDKPFNYPTTYPNDFSLPFDSYTNSRVGRYLKGTPLVPIGQVSKFDKDKDGIIDFPAVSGDDEKLHIDRKFRALLKKQFGSWNVRTIESTFATPLSNYIDSTKLFYGGNIAPYSKGTPLVPIGKDSQWKLFKYPTTVPTTPYSFDKPFGYPENYTNDFSLPFDSYTTSGRVTNYSKGTPLVPIGKDSQWKLFKYPTTVPTTPYSFDKPFGYPENYTNDFSLPFDSYTTSGRVTNYSKGTPLRRIDKESLLEKSLSILSEPGAIQYPSRTTLTEYFGSWNIQNPILEGEFNTAERFDPKVVSYVNRLGKYRKGTPLLATSFKEDEVEGTLKSKLLKFIGTDNTLTPEHLFSSFQLPYISLGTNSKSDDYSITLRNRYMGIPTKDDTDKTFLHVIPGAVQSTLQLTYNIIKNLQGNAFGRFGTLEQKWNSNKTEDKGDKYIGVGQVNDNETIYFGNKYYKRVEDNNDDLGIRNKKTNPSYNLAGFMSLTQPFVFYTPPNTNRKDGNPSMVKYETSNAWSGLLSLGVIELGRRGKTVTQLRNNLGVRASDAILSVSHFITDVARRQSVKPELPVKIFSSALGAVISNIGKNTEEFNDINNNPLETDMITFAFVYFDEDLKYNKHIQFKAYITQFNDTISPEWNSGKYIGHPNNYYTYKGVARSCQITFTVYSHNAYQREENWKKINKLASLCYPQYNTNNRMQGPIIKLNLGSLYKNMPGFINSLNFDISQQFPWETNSRELPHGINVSMNYTIIGHTLPEMNKNMHFDVFKTRRFAQTEDTKENTVGLGDLAASVFGSFAGGRLNSDTGETFKYTKFDGNGFQGADRSEAFEISEKINRKLNDIKSIAAETLAEIVPF